MNSSAKTTSLSVLSVQSVVLISEFEMTRAPAKVRELFESTYP
jgi:hypothetical protein